MAPGNGAIGGILRGGLLDDMVSADVEDRPLTDTADDVPTNDGAPADADDASHAVFCFLLKGGRCSADADTPCPGTPNEAFASASSNWARTKSGPTDKAPETSATQSAKLSSRLG